VVRRKRGGEEWRPGPVSWGSRRRERKGKEEVRESSRSRSDGEVEVLVMGGKEKEGDSVTWVAEGWESGGT
jgi:hypothetical protein